MKAHTENTKTRKAWCGREIPRDFNPWDTDLESCERCAQAMRKAHEKRVADAVKAKVVSK